MAKVTKGDWNAAATFAGEPLFQLDTLKISNITAEGPTKTATGGQSGEALLKYGKTFSLEMQDAMGRYDVLEAIYGTNLSKGGDILAITDKFPQEITIVGDTYVIDRKTGAKQPVQIVIPRFLGDGIFNLTQEAEGDISTFDLNGSVLRYSKAGLGEVAAVPNAVNTNAGKYKPGNDNKYYYFATAEGQARIAEDGFNAAMEEEVSRSAAYADLRYMLEQFGVVTVMDIKAYAAVMYDEDAEEPLKLSTPVVTQTSDTEITWGEVKNASGYTVKIGDSEQSTTETKYTVALGNKVQVRAIATAKTGYKDSDFSSEITIADITE